MPQSHQARVCIAGAGVAGLLLAWSLAAKGMEVHLLEGGGLEPEESSQQLYQAVMTGVPHRGVTEGRFRTFGGSSTRWGGQMLPYTEDVVHPPAVLGLPDWPVDLREIEPYYEKIQRVFGVAERPFSDALLAEFGRSMPFLSDEVRLRFSKWAPFSRRNLAGTLGRELLASGKVTVFTHASVVAVELCENGGAVRELRVVNDRGGEFRFAADVFVLCLGTIEGSRLLLASTSVSRAGVGNDRDQVGRYFHDHIGVDAAEIADGDRARVVDRFAPFVSGQTLHTPKLEATAKLRRERQLLSVMAHFPVEEPEDSGPGKVRAVLQGVQRRQFDRGFYAHVAGLPGASAEIAQLLWWAKVKGRRALSRRARISLHLDCEQRPQAESRIRIGGDRDRLGVPVCVVDWKISEDEHETVRKFAETIDGTLRKAGIASVKWRPEISEAGTGWLTRATDTFHMMGGTRMGTDPLSSVVDGNLRVHGVENLYIASCSTFPTGGSSNPTFTMMALTLRLKDRIAGL
ncbi:MAG: GMC family oxidoreductase [Silvibacterium sp.]